MSISYTKNQKNCNTKPALKCSDVALDKKYF